MNRDEMLRLFEAHRAAEAARDFDAILATFVDDCFLETVRSGCGRRARWQPGLLIEGFFTAFPDLSPDDQGMAFGDDVIVVWGACGEPAVATGSGFPRAAARFGAVRQRRTLQGWPPGGREDLLRPRHALRAGGISIDEIRAVKSSAGGGSVPRPGS